MSLLPPRRRGSRPRRKGGRKPGAQVLSRLAQHGCSRGVILSARGSSTKNSRRPPPPGVPEREGGGKKPKNPSTALVPPSADYHTSAGLSRLAL